MRGAVWLVLLAACTPATEPRKPDPHPHVVPEIGTTPTPVATTPSQRTSWKAAKLPGPTAMEADLKELGLDPKALPPLGKLEASTLRQVMKTFTRSLGVPCAGCHDVKAFAAPTRKKTIATHMWNDVARGLTTKDGAPLYCDSCHDGKATFLDRSDAKQLAAWMEQAYVAPLSRADGNEHNCATCHGEPFEGDIFGKGWK